jgi:hypothetical protein
MHRSRRKHSMRVLSGALVVGMTIAAGIASQSCFLGIKASFCERFDVICKLGQECAANQAVCIDINGCGDGIVNKEKGEACDDGNVVDGETDGSGVFIPDGCSHDCMSTQECGNGIVDVDAGEECDHGSENGSPDDNCDSHCHFASRTCGNGIVDHDVGEECDPGPMDSAGCNSNRAGQFACKAAKCGDGYINMAAGERCDTNGVDTAQCNGRLCTSVTCGDQYVNLAAGEECDSGSADTSICNGNRAGSASCRGSRCGDGYINAASGEQCEKSTDCIFPKVCNSCRCM